MSMPPPPLPLTPKRSHSKRAASVRPSDDAPIDVEAFSARSTSVPPTSHLAQVLQVSPTKRIKAEVTEGGLPPSSDTPGTPNSRTVSRSNTPSRSTPSPSSRRRSPSLLRSLAPRSFSRSPSVSPRALPRMRRSGTAPVTLGFPSGLNRRAGRNSSTPSPSPSPRRSSHEALRDWTRQKSAAPSLPSRSATLTCTMTGTNGDVVAGASPLRRGSAMPRTPAGVTGSTPAQEREATPVHLISRDRGRVASLTPGLVTPSTSGSTRRRAGSISVTSQHPENDEWIDMVDPRSHRVDKDMASTVNSEKDNGKGRAIDGQDGVVEVVSNSESPSASEVSQGSSDGFQVESTPLTFACTASSCRSPSSLPATGSHYDEEDPESSSSCLIEVHIFIKASNGDTISRATIQRQAYLGVQRCYNSRQNEVLDREAPKTARRLEKELRRVRREG